MYRNPVKAHPVADATFLKLDPDVRNLCDAAIAKGGADSVEIYAFPNGIPEKARNSADGTLNTKRSAPSHTSAQLHASGHRQLAVSIEPLDRPVAARRRRIAGPFHSADLIHCMDEAGRHLHVDVLNVRDRNPAAGTLDSAVGLLPNEAELRDLRALYVGAVTDDLDSHIAVVRARRHDKLRRTPTSFDRVAILLKRRDRHLG